MEREVAHFLGMILPPVPLGSNIASARVQPGGSEGHDGEAKNMIPDLVMQTDHPNLGGGLGRSVQAVYDLKTVASQSEYARTRTVNVADKRAERVVAEYESKAKELDDLWYLDHPEVRPGMGPVEAFLAQASGGGAIGLAVGRYGECSKSVLDLLGVFAGMKAARHEELTGVESSESQGAFKWDLRRRFVLVAARGWAQLRLKRAARLPSSGAALWSPALGEGLIQPSSEGRGRDGAETVELCSDANRHSSELGGG